MEDQNSKELHEQYSDPYDRDEVILEEDELTAMDRVLYAVTSPKRAFDRLLAVRLGPVIGVSLLVSIVLLIGTTALMFSSESFMEAMNERQAEQMQEALDDPNLTDDQREIIEGQMDFMASPLVMFGMGSIGIVLGVPFVTCLIALLILIIAKVLETGHESRVKFVHALSVASLGVVVYAVGGLIAVGIMFLVDPGAAQSGLAGLIETDSALAKGVVSALSPNLIWYYIVVGLGIATIARTTTMKAVLSFGIVLGLIMMAITMIGEMVGSMFSMGG